MDSAQLDTPPATPSPPASESGQIVAERYRLVRKLGEGGMGAVYLAEHIHMRKRFALKLLLPEAMASAEIVARFEREAIAAGNISHPGVCAATDFGRLPDGAFFLVLEYVDGRSLRSVLGDGALAPDRAINIARQILAALAAAHATGVVHRDIKPENVMLVQGPNGNDVVKVLDFGIAKVDANTLGEGQGTNLTRMGAIYGTPAYMAPEQAMGKAIDARVDLYAVGVMLHEMIAGRPPFEGDGVIILAKHVNDPPPRLVSPLDPNAVSDELRRVVERLLAKKPADRPADATRAIAELDAARATLGAFAPAPLDLGMHPTMLGATSSIQTQSPLVAGGGAPAIADAATVYGEASPTPPPTTTTAGARLRTVQSKLRVGRDRVVTWLEPVAKKVGVEARWLALGAACLAGLFFLLLVIVIARPSSSVEDDTAERRARRKPVAATPADKAADKVDEEPLAPPKPPPSTSASASSGKGGGGGLKGLGRKIKGLF